MHQIFLLVHIAGGMAALVGAGGALGTRKGRRGHALWGRAFALGMLVVFLTTLLMMFTRPNLFLLCVAVFSFYLVLTGWLRARNRSGAPCRTDWIAAATMIVTAIAMVVWGMIAVGSGNSMGIVLIAFGGIGGGSAIADLVALRGNRYRGSARIAAHLGRMLGGTIAAVTAFTVVNVRIEPAFVVWLAPTVVLAPVIAYWTARVLGGSVPQAAAVGGGQCAESD